MDRWYGRWKKLFTKDPPPSTRVTLREKLRELCHPDVAFKLRWEHLDAVIPAGAPLAVRVEGLNSLLARYKGQEAPASDDDQSEEEEKKTGRKTKPKVKPTKTTVKKSSGGSEAPRRSGRTAARAAGELADVMTFEKPAKRRKTTGKKSGRRAKKARQAEDEAEGSEGDSDNPDNWKGASAEQLTSKATVALLGSCSVISVSYTHLTLPTILLV